MIREIQADAPYKFTGKERDTESDLASPNNYWIDT
jgi:hypothetical protein